MVDKGPATSTHLLGRAGTDLTKPIWTKRSCLAPSIIRDATEQITCSMIKLLQQSECHLGAGANLASDHAKAHSVAA